MSRIGNKVIIVPNTVDIIVEENFINIKGKFGNLIQEFDNNIINIKFENNNLIVLRKSESKNIKAYHGLIRALLNNKIIGVNEKFAKVIIAEGVGYKFQQNNNKLYIYAGFTHPIILEIPSDISIKIDNLIKLSITGIDKEKVGFFADKIRKIKPPEPYKGKGLLFEGEKIKRKIGKKSK